MLVVMYNQELNIYLMQGMFHVSHDNASVPHIICVIIHTDMCMMTMLRRACVCVCVWCLSGCACFSESESDLSLRGNVQEGVCIACLEADSPCV